MSEMNRRSFLAGLTSLLVVAPATALATVQRLGTPSDWIARPTLITDSEISAMLRKVYADVRSDLFPTMTPLLAQMQKVDATPRSLYDAPKPRAMTWGGKGVVFDVQVKA
jgi:hypothetical protein